MSDERLEGAGRVEKATRAELRSLGWSVQTSGKAALAVSLAMHIDRARGGVAAAQVAAQLRVLLDELARAAAASRPPAAPLDDLRKRREARRAG